MPLDRDPLPNLVRAHDLAAATLRAARELVDGLRADIARERLRLAFPDHATAVLGRDLDSSRYRLLRLTAASADVDDVDPGDARFNPMPPAAIEAFWAAEHWLSQFTDDEAPQRLASRTHWLDDAIEFDFDFRTSNEPTRRRLD